jgi:signal recognition particle receptor subunit beta
MALINHAKKEINAKLVYFGPPASGKATNLHAICRKLKPECRSKLKSMAVLSDRMLFFDFTPPSQGVPAGYKIRFHVYTLTGPATSLSSWKMVLKGVDGIVFVADSDPQAMSGNMESLARLTSCLSDYGTSLGDIPCIVQYNKRDLSISLPLEDLENSLNGGGYPSVAAVATRGEGAVESLSRLVRMVTARVGTQIEGTGRGASELAAGDIGLETVAATAVSEEPSGIRQETWDAPAETVPALAGTPAEEGSAAGCTTPELCLSMAGEPQLLGDGQLRIPLQLRSGTHERRATLTISLSLAPGSDR